MKLKAGFWKKLNKIDKDLARLIKKREKGLKYMKGGDIITNTTQIQRIVRDYYVKLYVINWKTWKKWINS